MKQYRYFVAYGANNHSRDGIMLGIGEYGLVGSILNNTIVSVRKPILTDEDVRGMEQGIARELADGRRFCIVVKIISFQLLGEFESEEEGGE